MVDAVVEYFTRVLDDRKRRVMLACRPALLRKPLARSRIQKHAKPSVKVDDYRIFNTLSSLNCSRTRRDVERELLDPNRVGLS